MATTTTRRAALSDEDVATLLDLAAGADSVELKLTVPESDQRSAVTALGMDPLDAQIRQVFFFDTPDLALDRQGVVVRARRIQGKGSDSIVKLRPVVPDALPARLRRSPSMVVEVDAMPGGYVCSAALKNKLDSVDVREVAAGKLPLRKLCSKEQRGFFAEHAPEGLELDGLSVLGPVFVLKLKFTSPDFGRRLVAELWQYPDYSRILELSTKCAPPELFQAAAETRAYLARHGVEVSGEQQTKTKTALRFFSRRRAS